MKWRSTTGSRGGVGQKWTSEADMALWRPKKIINNKGKGRGEKMPEFCGRLSWMFM